MEQVHGMLNLLCGDKAEPVKVLEAFKKIGEIRSVTPQYFLLGLFRWMTVEGLCDREDIVQVAKDYDAVITNKVDPEEEGQ